jgi:hypothetical protein
MKQPTMKRTRWQWQWLSRMICVVAAMLLFVLSAQAQPTITAASNPVVVPNGQASGATTITWRAAPDYAYCEIYLSVDNGEWSEFARGSDGSKTAMVNLGSTHTFRMMAYEHSFIVNPLSGSGRMCEWVFPDRQTTTRRHMKLKERRT